MRKKKPPSRLRVIAHEDQRRLLDYLKRRINYRDHALIVLCLRTGLGTSEALNLNVGDIVKKDAVVNILEVSTEIARSGVSRRLPLDEEIRGTLQGYLQWKLDNQEPVEPSAPLFLTQRTRRRLSTRDFQRIVERASLEALGMRLTPHDLRHTFGTELYQRTGDPELVRYTLGLTTSKAARIYIHASSNEHAMKRKSDIQSPVHPADREGLELSVRRLKREGRDVLSMTACRVPTSTMPLPVRIEIRDDASKLLTTLQAREGEAVEWVVPNEVQGTIRITARQPNASGNVSEAQFTCRAHNIVPVIPQVGHWEAYDVTDGLGGSNVMEIIQTRDGALWFGLHGSRVSRYDGHKFRTLTTQDGLPSNAIWTIFEDSRGVLWIGTMDYFTWKGTGVCRYDPARGTDGGAFQTFTTKDGLAGDEVTAIYEDDRGHLWFGTRNGISEFDGQTFQNYTEENGLSDNLVGSIIQDKEGNLWFGHGLMHKAIGGGGTTRCDGKSFTHFTTQDGLPHDNVTSMTTDAHGNLWFGTNGGVSRYDGKTFQNFAPGKGYNNWITDVFQAKSGDLWFGTVNGVIRYRDGVFQKFTTKDGLAHNWVNRIAEDREGNLWFGTVIGGVSRYDESVVSIPVDIHVEAGTTPINIPIRDTRRNLWFAVSGVGLGQYDGKYLHTYGLEDGLPSTEIRGICEDSQGNIWFGTFGGLVKYDREIFQTFEYIDGRDVLVEVIYEDRAGVLWLGTMGGDVYTYDGGKFVQVVNLQELGGRWVSYIMEDKNGNMWFSMLSGGLCKYDGTTYTRFSTENGLPHNNCYQILEDRRGNIWIPTGSGLCCFDGNSFQRFTTMDNRAEDWLSRIHEDSDGNLWFGMGASGFHKFDGVNFQRFTKDDGLSSNTVWGILEDEEGNVIFGTSGGFTIYTPPKEKIPPPVFITEVVADKVYAASEELRIPATAKRISFAYHGISFKTKRMCYNYMLEGYDTDWQATYDEEVSYENLKPGEYVFKVVAINRDLVYSEEPAAVKLTVMPDPRDAKISVLQVAVNHLRREVGRKYHFQNIIGRAAGIRQVRALMERAIDSGLTVLITGETGTGKELVAKAIHYNSPRKDNPLLDRNCGAMPKELLASDLFGHGKGAFTGAAEDKMGLFEAASGGTVLLDEISEMPEDAQIHLLRVLEERKVQRLGEHISRDVDVRIIAMTNRDLVKEVKSRQFREDIYYRLSEFPIYIPPLRERLEDIPLLAEHFLQEVNGELNGFAADVLEMLQSYPWPGNVRELRNVIRRAVALVEEGQQIQTYHFPSQITRGESLIQDVLSERMRYSESLDRFRRRLIEEALRECDGNRSEAARRLGMDRSNLRALMKRLGIQV